MHYEKYKTKMQLSDMNLVEKIPHSNLLCGGKHSDDELRIAMREKPQKIFQKLFLPNSTTSESDYNFLNIKQETLLKNTIHLLRNTGLMWQRNSIKIHRNNYNNRKSNSKHDKPVYKKNLVNCDSIS